MKHMRSLAKMHGVWLSDYPRSSLYACPESAHSCGVYHVLAPILHDLGIFRSFESYAAILRQQIIEILLAQDEIHLLVAGIDSESSARVLVENIAVFRPRIQVTFLDRCATPLNRIASCLEEGEEYIQTWEQDIATAPKGTPKPGYDLVLLDSFLKQFDSPRRLSIVQALRACLRPGQGRMILREYFGTFDDLLPLLWERLVPSSPAFPSRPFLQPDDWRRLLRRVPPLERYIRSTGEFYEDPETLLAELKRGGMVMIEQYSNPSQADRLFVAKAA